MRDFAPISSGPSVRLHFAAGYFAFTGGSALVLLILAMATAAAGNVTFARSTQRASVRAAAPHCVGSTPAGNELSAVPEITTRRHSRNRPFRPAARRSCSWGAGVRG